ncbi:hypothetical protein BS78_03G407500 [Paspalum vaginatum]|nr:hypothetical protein BS78_03G407500 [Paspalum vaginatum]
MAQQQSWSSLPADLVSRVADCLLATNDLDYYDDLRGVCHHWRSATDDPRRNQHDPRFRATRWVMLGEREYHYSAGSGDAFVNIATGRFLRKNLAPLLRDHVLLTTTTGGLLVLAARRGGSRPHAVAVRVANPFTGSVIRFAAPLQNATGLRFTADVVGFSHTLVLVSVTSNEVFWADPQSESFSVDTSSHGSCPACRLPLIAAGKCAAVVMGHGRRESLVDSLAVANNVVDQPILSGGGEDGCRCYVVEAGASAGELLAVLKRSNGVDVFKIDSARNSMERVRSIGTRALFLGIRSFLVDADRLPTIKPNCAYFLRTDIAALARDVYRFDIAAIETEQKPEWVEEGIRDNDFIWPINLRPFTVTQLLCNYTMDILCHQPVWDGSCFGEYIDN